MRQEDGFGAGDSEPRSLFAAMHDGTCNLVPRSLFAALARKSRRYHLRHCTTDTPNPTPIASAIEVGSAGSDEFARSLLLLARERGKLLLHKAHHQRVEVFHTVAALRHAVHRARFAGALRHV